MPEDLPVTDNRKFLKKPAEALISHLGDASRNLGLSSAEQAAFVALHELVADYKNKTPPVIEATPLKGNDSRGFLKKAVNSLAWHFGEAQRLASLHKAGFVSLSPAEEKCFTALCALSADYKTEPKAAVGNADAAVGVRRTALDGRSMTSSVLPATLTV